MMRTGIGALLVAGQVLLSVPAIASIGYPKGAPVPLTIENAIDTARFVTDRDGQAVFASPDRRRYVVAVVRGDVKRDGVQMEFLSGQLGARTGARPRLSARLFTHALPPVSPVVDYFTGAPALVNPGSNVPVWLNDKEIAFLWGGKNGHNQIFKLDVRSGKLDQITEEGADIATFRSFGTGSLVYDVKVPYSSQRSRAMVKSGFSVKSPDADMLLSGIVDGTSLYDFTMCRRAEAIRVDGGYRFESIGESMMKCDTSQLYWGGRLVSPDQRQIILNVQVSPVPPEWSAYTGHFAAQRADAQANPHGFGATLMSCFVVVDLRSGEQRQLWQAPAGTNPWSTVSWSPNSRRVLVAPTYLPSADADAVGLRGEAVAIVDVRTGRYARLPVNPDVAVKIISTAWIDDETVSLHLRSGGAIRLLEQKGVWQEESTVPDPEIAHRVEDSSTVSVQQDANHPPVLVAENGRHAGSQILYDPNQGLMSRFALGRVEFVRWRDAKGHPWTGRLYYPAHYHAGTRYPLVIQTHGYASAREFSIYGVGGSNPATGPGWSVFIAQSLASRDIAVLQIGGPDDGFTLRESDFIAVQRRAAGLGDAAQFLVKLGLVDETRVGIMGHSASGRIIEEALAFTDFHFAAAIASDYAQLSYSQCMELGWEPDEGMPAPFGADLATWMNGSPTFNVERIQTPLQIEVTSGSGSDYRALLRGWEMFSRLRYLRKPVEYYVLPDIGRGSHLVQNPRQLSRLQNRALDWWLFWLRSEEDRSPAKAVQYQEWHALRELHQIDAQKARPPLLHWTAVSK